MCAGSMSGTGGRDVRKYTIIIPSTVGRGRYLSIDKNKRHTCLITVSNTCFINTNRPCRCSDCRCQFLSPLIVATLVHERLPAALAPRHNHHYYRARIFVLTSDDISNLLYHIETPLSFLVSCHKDCDNTT